MSCLVYCNVVEVVHNVVQAIVQFDCLLIRQLARTTGLFLHTWCSSLLGNVYIPGLRLDLSCAPLSYASVARFVPQFAKRRCFRERRQRQVFSCLSADKSEDCHAKKTSNPVR
jgi:hypothetical protein